MPKREPGPYAVICPNHGQIFLSGPEYDWQMMLADSLWRCPECGESADWDDANYEEYQELLDDDR